MRKYKTSYKSTRGVKRFRVSFDGEANVKEPQRCIYCGDKVEECPMAEGVCYYCYREGRHKGASHDTLSAALNDAGYGSAGPM